MVQDEYFTVNANLKINIEVLSDNEPLPTMENFINEIPTAFKIASQCNALENKSQTTILEINDSHSVIERLLHTQNEKINLLLGFMLSQLDDEKLRCHTEAFGASGLSFISHSSFTQGQYVRLKLFLDHPSTAVYCYGQISSSSPFDEKFRIGINYCLLQEDDRDVLIRAALYYQQKLLRQRAQARQNT